jgi:RND family efflux transporter MFP subunit
MKYRTIELLLGAALLLWGCGERDAKKQAAEKENVEIVLPTEEVEVRTETLKTVEFEHELVSNGRVSAQEVAELKFTVSSGENVPVKIFVKNGAHVNKGDAIAMLDTFALSNAFRQAEDNLRKTYLELQDVLIGQGFAISDTSRIPPETLQLAYIRSGYNSALISYSEAKYKLENATLRSPIAGIVADLFAKPFCQIDGSAPFCIVFNQNRPEVEFKILENELPLIKMGDKVKIQSYASPDVESVGSIASINPNVDKEGTVRIKAYIQYNPNIFNGMNVRISVFRSLGKQWVIPKTAVVLRTGKQVVFAFKDGKAAWNYVETGFENATHVTVTSKTLTEGDEIIISGNEHLADGTVVQKI